MYRFFLWISIMNRLCHDASMISHVMNTLDLKRNRWLGPSTEVCSKIGQCPEDSAWSSRAKHCGVKKAFREMVIDLKHLHEENHFQILIVAFGLPKNFSNTVRGTQEWSLFANEVTWDFFSNCTYQGITGSTQKSSLILGPSAEISFRCAGIGTGIRIGIGFGCGRCRVKISCQW